MKIESNNLRNEIINFSNKLIKFDENGIASVDEEIGKEFIKEFPKSYWEFGKKPIIEYKKKDFIKKEDSIEVVSLKNEILKLKGIRDSLKVQLKNSQEETEVWKVEFNKLREGNLEIDISKDNKDENIEKDELKSELENMNVSDLRKLLKDEFQDEEKNYKGLNKKELIVRILEKTK